MAGPFNEDSRLAADALHWQANDIEFSRGSSYEKEHGTHHRFRALSKALESGELVVVPANRVAGEGRLVVDSVLLQTASFFVHCPFKGRHDERLPDGSVNCCKCALEAALRKGAR